MHRGPGHECPWCVMGCSAPAVVVGLSLWAEQRAYGFGGVEGPRVSVDDRTDVSAALGGAAELPDLEAGAFDDRLDGFDGAGLAGKWGVSVLAALACRPQLQAC